MATQVSYIIRDSVAVPSPTPVLGTSFATADVHQHQLTQFSLNPSAPFRTWIESIHVRLSNLAGGATTCTIRLCLDSAGDYTIVPDVTATIVTGLTTTTSGCIAVDVGIPAFGEIRTPDGTVVISTNSVYLFAKLDAGTADFVASCIHFRE